MISSGTHQELISCMKVGTIRDITHKLCVYDLVTSVNRRPVSRTAAVIASYWLLAYTSYFSSWSMLQSMNATGANILPALSVLDDQCPDIQLARKLTYSLYSDDQPSLSPARRLERRHNSQWRSIRLHCGDCSDDKRNLPPHLMGCDAAVNVLR